MARTSRTTAELAEVAAGLRRLLDAIRSGELSAGSGEVTRLEGRLAAVDALRDPSASKP